MLSPTEENYLKALLKMIISSGTEEIGTNQLAHHLTLKPATVNDMLKRLKDKDLVDYQKYGKIKLTQLGKSHATSTVRKHRLWETFLHEKLSFSWDEVHDVAEQLEHIQSEKLIIQLDKFLNYPNFDPHGDPIPNENGELKIQYKKKLSEVAPGKTCQMIAVNDNSSLFLQYVAQVGLKLNTIIKIVSKQEYDSITIIEIDGYKSSVSQKFTENIFVVCQTCLAHTSCLGLSCDLNDSE